MEKGEVFIITNAAYGWVEFSSKKLYPLTYNILKRIKIISARGIYQKKLPGDYRQWKSFAFIDTVMKYNTAKEQYDQIKKYASNKNAPKKINKKCRMKKKKNLKLTEIQMMSKIK